MTPPDRLSSDQPAPEFSRPVVAGGLPRAGRTLVLEATAGECAALAARFAIPGIESLTARVTLRPLADGSVRVSGRLEARVTQVCVVALEPFSQRVEAEVAITFVPQDVAEARGGTGGIDPDAEDEELFEGASFDLGEALAQSLSLALDPWPRNPASALPADAAAPDPAQPEGQGEGARENPFAVLARRRS